MSGGFGLLQVYDLSLPFNSNLFVLLVGNLDSYPNISRQGRLQPTCTTRALSIFSVRPNDLTQSTFPRFKWDMVSQDGDHFRQIKTRLSPQSIYATELLIQV